jgi:hypothetical protein
MSLMLAAVGQGSWSIAAPAGRGELWVDIDLEFGQELAQNADLNGIGEELTRGRAR